MIELILVLVMTHITIVCVTVYLHRGQAHRGLTFNPVLEHFMRFWLWMTTGMLTREWVAVHRLHHRKCETPEDPHSPITHGIWKVLFGGAWLYVQAKKDRQMVEQYGAGTPDDWIECNLYTRFPKLGFISLLIIEVAIFGWTGLLMWGVQMIWIPWWAAGVINGLGHWWGYRNAETNDNSKNILPWGIIVGGEELHANHHLSPASSKLSLKWWEFDIGWMYIKILEAMRLITLVKR
jgi:stearoyl-CoA desaturase (Delta-9 desaturase)